MHKYRLISKKGEGTFSEVLKAQSVKNGQYFAIKCMKNHFQSIEQVNNLREIQALKRLNPHGNIVRLQEVLFDKATGRLALVFELMDMNMYELIRGRKTYLSERRLKSYTYQMMKAIDHMHKSGIFHRDIKPENILLCDDKLKVADFGSCRGIFSKPPYTEYISTRWYRAPECLLTDGWYDYKMDIWSVGCVFFEIISLFPLFPGTNELDQIERIHNVTGSPSSELLDRFKKYSSHLKFDFPPKEAAGIGPKIPHCSKPCVDLIEELLTYNPDQRPTARQSLQHLYFKDMVEEDRRHKLKRESRKSKLDSSRSHRDRSRAEDSHRRDRSQRRRDRRDREKEKEANRGLKDHQISVRNGSDTSRSHIDEKAPAVALSTVSQNSLEEVTERHAHKIHSHAKHHKRRQPSNKHTQKSSYNATYSARQIKFELPELPQIGARRKSKHRGNSDAKYGQTHAKKLPMISQLSIKQSKIQLQSKGHSNKYSHGHHGHRHKGYGYKKSNKMGSQYNYPNHL